MFKVFIVSLFFIGLNVSYAGESFYQDSEPNSGPLKKLLRILLSDEAQTLEPFIDNLHLQ